MKTKDLIGPALDWAVALANGWVNYPTDSIEQGRYWHFGKETPSGHVTAVKDFKPSSDWGTGGPVIEQEEVMLLPPLDDDGWTARCGGDAYPGGTPLIAAMRCYVASKLGDVVDVPEGLMRCYVGYVTTGLMDS